MSGQGGDERDRAKGLANEILPDPTQAEHDLAAGGPRGRTVEHLKRILAAAGAALSLQGAAALTLAADGCTPSGGAADKKAGDTSSKEPSPDAKPVPPPPPSRPIAPAGYGVVDPLPDPSYRSERRHHKPKKKAGGEKKGK